MSLVEQLAGAIVAEDPDTVRDLLVAATEKERREADGPLRDQLGHLLPKGRRSLGRDRAAAIALLGTSTIKDLRLSFGMSWYAAPLQPAVDVLKSRPEKLRNAVLREATSEGALRWLWPVAFQFIRSGEFPRPETPEYAISALLYLLAAREGWEAAGQPRNDERRVRIMRERWRDPVMADELLAAFHHEEAALWALGYGNEPVIGALRAGVDDGSFDRGRMLDVCLDGHLRDFRPSATRLFARLWRELEPSASELADRVGLLVRVGTTRDPGGQTLAITAIGQLLEVGVPLEPEETAAVGSAALAGTTKKLGLAALGLLDRIAETAPETAVQAALTGVGHSRADIQEASLAFIEEHLPALSDPLPVRQELLGWTDTVEPQLRARIDRLTGIVTTEPVADPAMAVERISRGMTALSPEALAGVGLAGLDPHAPRLPAPLRFDPWEAPIFAPDRAITPIEDPAELVETVVAWMAGSADGIDVERAIDGLARIGAAHAGTPGISAVRTQIERLENEWGGSASSIPSVRLALAWLDRSPPPRLDFVTRRRTRSGLAGRLSTPRIRRDRRQFWLGMTAFDGLGFPAHPAAVAEVRIWELAHHLAEGESRPLLAAPTHHGGWVHPEAFCRRLQELEGRGLVPDRFDACQALLRLPPREDGQTVDRLLSIGTDPARAAARLLGADAPVSDEGLRRAVRVRLDLDMPVPTRRPGSRPEHADHVALRWPGAAPGEALRRDDPLGVALAGLASPADEVRWWNDANALLAGADRTGMSLAVTTLPRFPDLYGAAVATTIVFDLDANRSSDADHIALAVFGDPDVPLGTGAHAGLMLALAARNETLATVAVDVLIAAAEDGRLDADLLGRLLAQAANEGVAGLSRPSERLATASEPTVLHADTVRRVWSSVLRALHDPPRDLHAALGTLLAAGSRSGRGIDDPEARRYLEGVATGRSKRAGLARAVLDLPAEWADLEPELQAVEGRVARAERWRRERLDTTGSSG